MICGIPYKVELVDDSFDLDLHLGLIKYGEGVIRINAALTPELQMQALFHEMVHGMLVLIGRDDAGSDEQLVQGLANAMYQSFQLRADGYETPYYRKD